MNPPVDAPASRHRRPVDGQAPRSERRQRAGQLVGTARDVLLAARDRRVGSHHQGHVGADRGRGLGRRRPGHGDPARSDQLGGVVSRAREATADQLGVEPQTARRHELRPGRSGDGSAGASSADRSDSCARSNAPTCSSSGRSSSPSSSSSTRSTDATPVVTRPAGSAASSSSTVGSEPVWRLLGHGRRLPPCGVSPRVGTGRRRRPAVRCGRGGSRPPPPRPTTRRRLPRRR